MLEKKSFETNYTYVSVLHHKYLFVSLRRFSAPVPPSARYRDQMKISNHYSKWVASMILHHQRTLADQIKLLYLWIKIAFHCHQLQNFNSVFEIMAGIGKLLALFFSVVSFRAFFECKFPCHPIE